MDDKQKKQKIAIGVVLGIVFLVAVFYFVLGPVFGKISDMRSKVAEEKVKIEQAEAEIADRDRTKANLKKSEEKIERHKANMPSGAPDWLLARLNNLSENCGISFDKIEPKECVSDSEKYKLQGLYLELKADYHRLGKFINEFENLSPMLKVIDISVTIDKNNPEKHLVKLTLGAYVNVEK